MRLKYEVLTGMSENLKHLRERLIERKNSYLERGGLPGHILTLYDTLITLIKQLEERER